MEFKMICVTGATGQLGKAIIENLLQTIQPSKIIAVSRSLDKASSLADRKILVRQGDYNDYDSLVAAFEGVDTLMFISGSEVGQRIAQHRTVIDAAKGANVGRVVYTSIADTEGDSVIIEEHMHTENYLKDSGLNYTILRCNLYADLYISEIKNAIEQGSYRSATGDAGCAFITRNDIARSAASALSGDGHENKVYMLTGPYSVTASDFARIASEISGKEITVEPVTFDGLMEKYREWGLPDEIIPLAVGVEKLISTGGFAEVSKDVELLTGTPATSLDSFAAKALS